MIGAQLWIGDTAAEAALHERVSLLRSRIAQMRWHRDARAVDRRELQAELERLHEVEPPARASALGALAAERGRTTELGLLALAFAVTAVIATGSLARSVWRSRERALYATRTLVTGASRSATVDHDEPASAEPKTSPLVAPK